MEQLINENVFDPPEVMVESLLDNFIRDYQIPEAEQAAFREDQLVGAQNVVRRMLLLDAVAKKHEITVDDDEVEATIREESRTSARRQKPCARRRKDGSFARRRHALRERKTMDFLLEKAEIEEVRVDRPSAPDGAPAG